MVNQSRRLGELLVERKVLSREALEAALQREAAEGRSLPAILMAEGLVAEKDLLFAIAAQLGKPSVDLSDHVIPPELDRTVPAELAHRHLAVAVDYLGTDLLVAMENPDDAEALAALAASTGWGVVGAVAVRSELQRIVNAMYGPSKATGAAVATSAAPPSPRPSPRRPRRPTTTASSRSCTSTSSSSGFSTSAAPTSTSPSAPSRACGCTASSSGSPSSRS